MPLPQLQVSNASDGDAVHIVFSSAKPILVTDDVRFKFYCSTVSVTTEALSSYTSTPHSTPNAGPQYSGVPDGCHPTFLSLPAEGGPYGC